MLSAEQEFMQARGRRYMKLYRYRRATQYTEALQQMYPTLIRYLTPGIDVRSVF